MITFRDFSFRNHAKRQKWLGALTRKPSTGIWKLYFNIFRVHSPGSYFYNRPEIVWNGKIHLNIFQTPDFSDKKTVLWLQKKTMEFSFKSCEPDSTECQNKVFLKAAGLHQSLFHRIVYYVNEPILKLHWVHTKQVLNKNPFIPLPI